MKGYEVEHRMQIKLIHRLYETWRKYPTVRLGQLVASIVKDKDLFALHDEQFLSMLEAFQDEHTTDPR